MFCYIHGLKYQSFYYYNIVELYLETPYVHYQVVCNTHVLYRHTIHDNKFVSLFHPLFDPQANTGSATEVIMLDKFASTCLSPYNGIFMLFHQRVKCT